MKYSETGQFTKEQIRLAKNIARNIKKLRDTGCTVIGKQWSLVAFLDKDYEHKDDLMRPTSGYKIPYIDCGDISDSGADDTEFFEEGYITEE